MIQIIAFILLGISIGGMVFVLTKAQEKEQQPQIQKAQIKERIEKISLKPSFEFENFLRKILLRLKIFFLRCENKIDFWLKQISHSKKFSDDYWEKIKKK